MTESVQSWSMIILCYNEEGSVYNVLGDVVKTFEKMNVQDYEVLVVNDGSTDNSVEQINKFIQTSNKVKLIIHPKNLGIGKVLLTGYAHATKENKKLHLKFKIMKLLFF